MVSINKQFKKNVKELENLHYVSRDRLNSLTRKGEELFESLREEFDSFEPTMLNILNELWSNISKYDDNEVTIHKAYVKSTKYYKIVQEAPFYWRIMNKPEGYAGDSEMMDFIYRNSFEGETPFGMFLHKLAVENLACQAVRNRARIITEEILSLNEGKVLSLAAGPVKEIKEALSKSPETNSYQFLALDHDHKTLEKTMHSYKRQELVYGIANAFRILRGNYKIMIPKKKKRGRVNGNSNEDFEFQTIEKENFDLVYSLGLYDYITTSVNPKRGTVALTKNLFEFVKPGGSLIIGNFSRNMPNALSFPMEYVYNWQLVYRSESDLLEFATTISEKQIEDIKVYNEPTGINYFLRIDKKSA